LRRAVSALRAGAVSRLRRRAVLGRRAALSSPSLRSGPGLPAVG